MAMNIQANAAGFFKLEVRKVNEDAPHTTIDWFPNLITNQGLDRLGVGATTSYCSVGSGNSTPVVGNTGLDLKVGSSASKDGTVSSGAISVAPYYGWRRHSYSFPVNTVIGNLSEVGIGWGGGTNNDSLFSRSLIKDENGNPITLSIVEDDLLTITYELRLYPILTDSTGTINTGLGTHTYTLRAANVTKSQWYGDLGYYNVLGYSSTAFVYPTDIGDVFNIPSGSNSGYISSSETKATPYVAGSHYRDMELSFGITSGNNAAGIRSFVWLSNQGLGAFQVQFEPAIPKTNLQRFDITIRVGWGRYTP
jgi:hypothetical protein